MRKFLILFMALYFVGNSFAMSSDSMSDTMLVENDGDMQATLNGGELRAF
jgi:hypothetical protein